MSTFLSSPRARGRALIVGTDESGAGELAQLTVATDSTRRSNPCLCIRITLGLVPYPARGPVEPVEAGDSFANLGV